MHAEILHTYTPSLFDAAVARAAEALRRGELVALPTETVYGLAANAFDATAVEKIFRAKGRPSHNPLIVHVSDLAMAQRCAAAWPELADRLAAAFWPGPLTMVLPRSKEIPDAVTAGGPTVGIRWPSHPIMQAVIRATGFPLAAPSANRSNEISPTNATHVARSLGDRIALIIDGGQSQVGIESTVLDISETPPSLLRPGMIHEESLIAVTGSLDARAPGQTAPRRSPGMLPRHYAPKARLVVLSWNNEAEFALRLAGLRLPASGKRIFVIAHTHIPVGANVGDISVIPHDAEAFARAFYAELHRCDEAGAELIVMEALPSGPEWRAIADRMDRASAGVG
ncbi:MAG TPA: L-threonylcarbamoyladenylate synthase [Methylomirabilota bacterium]|nr:L-threonylcarbamoyladenylate synthase [Methylomirabilota bacterium]